MGLSVHDYMKDRLTNNTEFDEVWCINRIGGILNCDKVFMIDDAMLLRHERAGYEWLDDTTTPVFTKKKYEELSDALVEYPYDEIKEKFGTGYFSNTVAYAIAYAIHTGVKELIFFGCDYDYNGMTHEVNRAGTEFWIGIAYALGVKIKVSDQSSLMNMNGVQSYAYDEPKDAEGDK